MKQLVISLVIKLLIKSQKIHNKIIQSKETPKKRYIFPEERQEIIDESKINIKV